VQGQVQAGQLKILAVGGPARWPTLPEVPTVAETGVPGYAVIGWYGWLYPAGTPKAIVDKTNAALKEVLARPDIRDLLAKAGAVVHVSTPAEFGRQIEDEIVKWSSVREKAGIEQR
jgi:tripartite-type tricarboxylate transporter receptor subunit TctC